MPGTVYPEELSTVPAILRDRARQGPRSPALRRGLSRLHEINLRVMLPRATWTVPLARHLTRSLLRRPQVGDDNRTAVEIALSEACGNAVRHAAPATHYGLRLHIREATCLVEVTDNGTGIDLDRDPTMPTVQALSGRGLAIIARVADKLEIRRQHPTGTLLRFVKVLT